MFTRAIFIRPDSELIRESVCACAKKILTASCMPLIVTIYKNQKELDEVAILSSLIPIDKVA
jgi:hypothetical protein